MSTLVNSTTTSQCAAILEHLRKGHKITALDALNKFHCFRLASRIYDLTKKGEPIGSRFVKVKNEDGRQVQVKEYYLTTTAHNSSHITQNS